MVSITIPIVMKFTYKNLSTILTITMLAITFGGSSLLDELSQIITININNITIIAFVASFLLFFISFFVSTILINKKEILN